MTFTIVLIAAGVLMLLVFPVLSSRESWDLDEVPARLLHLKRARDRLLRTLKDIETEYSEGSLLESDYLELRRGIKQEAVEVTRELERVRGAMVRRIAHGPGLELEAGVEERLESLIAREKEKIGAEPSREGQ